MRHIQLTDNKFYYATKTAELKIIDEQSFKQCLFSLKMMNLCLKLTLTINVPQNNLSRLRLKAHLNI